VSRRFKAVPDVSRCFQAACAQHSGAAHITRNQHFWPTWPLSQLPLGDPGAQHLSQLPPGARQQPWNRSWSTAVPITSCRRVYRLKYNNSRFHLPSLVTEDSVFFSVTVILCCLQDISLHCQACDVHINNGYKKVPCSRNIQLSP